MKNLDKVDPFRSTVVKTDFGTITTLVAEIGVSEKDSICYDGKTLLAAIVYTGDGSYDMTYTVIDREGNHQSYKDDDGINPTLFLSPDNEAYVSVTPYHPGKDFEISIPVFNRENTELPKGNRQFLGYFIGTVKQFSILFDVDIWSDTKPDKLLAVEFKNGAIKKKHNSKIPLPRDNKIFIAGGEIHLLASDGEDWRHRQIDETGKTVRERHIKPISKYFDQILNLSFENDSYVLCCDDGKITVGIISADGKCENRELVDIADPFYNTWRPEKIAEDTCVTRFNGEFGNGWFTIKNDRLLELFYSKGVKGYKNLLTNEVLQMDNENLCIGGLNKTVENSYAVVFYPMTDRDVKNKELIILNRTLS